MDESEQLAIYMELADKASELEKIASLLQGYVQLRCTDRQVTYRPFDFRLRLVEGRVKPGKSVIGKLRGRSLPAGRIWSLGDVVGIRAVVVTSEDAKLLEER